MDFETLMDFETFATRATRGYGPYPYQARLADEGLPDVLRAPTGSGKTLAATLPWAYRRLLHPDETVRGATPRWLVVVLPQRTLVEQTAAAVGSWLASAELPVPVHVLMGGEDTEDRAWRMEPTTERIFVGTQDMVLSRLLMRGYAEPRGRWPSTYGLLHNDVQFVFDEVQLMGPALPTSLQLQGLREAMGTVRPTHTMWMSATLDPAALSTIDMRRPLRIVELTEEDRTGELLRRLDAQRTVLGLDLGGADARRYPAALAVRVLAEHRPGSRTLVVLNTVDRAMAVADALAGLHPAPDLVLLHSRFRPADRARQTTRALADPDATGLIVITTQVLEAGVDVTSETLFTEAAPWSSIVQRAGRCNRDGRADDARLLWFPPPAGRGAHLPYEQAEIEHTVDVLTGLEGRAMTGEQLAATAGEVNHPQHPVLRRKDLLDLFDTAADLFGNDIDVAPFIRDTDERMVFVAWRGFPIPQDAPAAARGELCPAPMGPVRELARNRDRAVQFDQRTGDWLRAEDIHPGSIIVLDAARGGYLPERGFDPAATAAVPAAEAARSVRPESLDGDPLSTLADGEWVSLQDHLADTEREAEELLDAFRPDITPDLREAIVLAARHHDLGKAHPTFQDSLRRANPDSPPPGSGGPWAKSPSRRPLRHNPPHFRHELVSALILGDLGSDLLTGVTEAALVTYLAGAHHGAVRVTVRGHPDERGVRVLGVTNGDRTLACTVPGGEPLPPQQVSLDAVHLGIGSLTSRALHLRNRSDLGPFRLAWCEAVVVAADWRASARPGKRSDQSLVDALTEALR